MTATENGPKIEDNFTCLLCSDEKPFIGPLKTLRGHIRQRHVNDSAYKCRICAAKLGSKIEILAHLRMIHLRVVDEPPSTRKRNKLFKVKQDPYKKLLSKILTLKMLQNGASADSSNSDDCAQSENVTKLHLTESELPTCSNTGSLVTNIPKTRSSIEEAIEAVISRNAVKSGEDDTDILSEITAKISNKVAKSVVIMTRDEVDEEVVDSISISGNHGNSPDLPNSVEIMGTNKYGNRKFKAGAKVKKRKVEPKLTPQKSTNIFDIYQFQSESDDDDRPSPTWPEVKQKVRKFRSMHQIKLAQHCPTVDNNDEKDQNTTSPKLGQKDDEENNNNNKNDGKLIEAKLSETKLSEAKLSKCCIYIRPLCELCSRDSREWARSHLAANDETFGSDFGRRLHVSKTHRLYRWGPVSKKHMDAMLTECFPKIYSQD